MKKETLISSYDEKNDIFAGKLEKSNGYCANYGIAEDIFLSIDKNNLPASVMVNNASEVFNVSKQFLENPNVEIGIVCDGSCLYFTMSVEDLKICNIKCKNSFGIPNIDFVMNSNS